MSGDPQKTPHVQTLSAFGDQKVADHIERLGQGLPCHVTAVAGQLVTVAFDIAENGVTLPPVTIPIATSLYDWLPVQIGDRGYTAAATIRLNNAAGTGGGTPDLTQPANLTALVYVPVSNAGWTVPNANQRVVQGPAGVLARTLDGTVSINATKTGITLTVGSKTWSFTAAGFIMSNGVVSETHIHTQGVDSHDDTEAPTNGPQNP